jgi:putative nucleotidyltransferase with HDIG domain
MIYGAILLPLKGDLYPLFLAILLVIPGYFYGRLLIDLMRHRQQNRYRSLAIGIAIGFVLAMIDVIGVFRGKPLVFWLRSPYIIGVIIVSLSFAWAFLAQYSWIFATLTKSQHEIERLVAKSNRDFVEFVQLIAKTLDAKDTYTAGHSLRVMDYAIKIARALQLPDKEIELLKQACLLHDIGKISIPDGILNKKKKLTAREREYILKHPVVGKKILSTVSDFKDILDIIYAHHERVDGTGYPDGRTENDIPFLARILAVADTYDAMRSERPYRPAKEQNEAIEELILAKGSQLDAEVVDIFIEAISNV